jgi:hypothetical protein
MYPWAVLKLMDDGAVYLFYTALMLADSLLGTTRGFFTTNERFEDNFIR